MASDYNKTVTSRNSVNPANFSFNTGNIIGYPNKISSGSRSSSGGSTTNITLNLDELLTDNLEEGVTSEKIVDPKQYNTDEKKGFFESIGDVFASVGATLAVGTTSILSGVLDIVEGIGDGVVWVASKAVGIVSPDAEEAMKEFIARDLVSEANEWLYEDTEFGRAINDASYMKYDSELAQGIRDVTEDVAVFAAATALTVFTGGAAAPLTIGLGAAYGLGEASESTYATYGTDTSTFQELLILGNGALSALSWYTSGKLGKGFIELGKSMAEAGVKEILAEMCKGIFSKETLKELLKPGNLVGNAIASLMQAGGDIGLIATKLYNGAEVTPEEWALLVGELIIYFGLNTAEDVLSDTIISYGNPKIDVDMNKTPDADDAKPIETLDETGLEDAAPKQLSADTPAPKPNETLDEPEILPEGKTPHPDDEYLDKALDILDPNTATKLSDEIGKLDDEGLQKVLSAMTGAEIAAQLKDLDAKDMDRVLNALSGDQLTDVVGELAERISKGELPSDILDKLDPSVKLEVLERTDPNFVQNGDGWQMFWENNDSITPELAATAENNYQQYSTDFTGRKEYYRGLADVESKNYEGVDENGKPLHIVLDPSDPGITRPLTDQAKNGWSEAVRTASDPSTGKTRVNVGNANPYAFDRFVVGSSSGQYGNFGMPDNYNFGRLGDADPGKFLSEAKTNGTDVITQFKNDSGIPLGASEYDRLIFASHDVDTNSVSMHTGKELNSYSQRLPGGRLPSGEYEVVYETQRITQSMANNTPVQIIDSSGKIIYDGTLSELNTLKFSNNPEDVKLYNFYVYGN